jgi:hypothetical protein
MTHHRWTLVVGQSYLENPGMPRFDVSGPS